MTVSIDDAIEAYFDERKSELSDSSLQNHRYQLQRFSEWSRGAGNVDSIGDIIPLKLSKFRRHRSSDINSNTMYNQLCILRLFLRFCHRMGWVREEISESIVLPRRDGGARDSAIDPDRMEALLDELDRYPYASLTHVIAALMWTCSMRISGVRSLDVGDIYLDEWWIDVNHRPETGTPLKNKEVSEREINIHPWVQDVLRDWIDDRRPDIEDSHGHTPLIASGAGRLSRSSIRRRVCRLTACGGVGDGYACSADRASQCDECVPPHDIRRTSISSWFDDVADIELLAGRVDCSLSTMREHYDYVQNKTSASCGVMRSICSDWHRR